ncbi:1,2-dihydroxy-3-keto-5-methylthiopentene dioxygenase [Tuber magnatum]|uniref:Acireductone dioxygenase n=1 Tax=Tuber magnatum TaxID=42249 RepID=A0A317SHW9_9PEZI|nr:1,2-dihydroxy-3-keto-5-methylthiopentene dioxygenase [Tuber magnatum]
MRTYEYDNSTEDQREDHDSGAVVSEASLNHIGVLTYHFDSVDDVNALAAERGYKNRDEITISPSALGDLYEAKVKTFFHEHLHEDEEIRYILDGDGFFDVRSKDDRWVRIGVSKGDLIILPAGIYHRFTTDKNNYIKAMRLFQEEPKWTPLNRDPQLDENAYRKAYVKSLSVA